METLLLSIVIGVFLLCGEDGGVFAQTTDELGFEARTYDGTENNLLWPLWGSVNITQVRSARERGLLCFIFIWYDSSFVDGAVNKDVVPAVLSECGALMLFCHPPEMLEFVQK